MAMVSAMFGVRVLAGGIGEKAVVEERRGVATVECSSRPQKKGTKHHIKTRPKKTQAWDIKRKPTVYPKLPELAKEWTLVEAAAAVMEEDETVAVEVVSA